MGNDICHLEISPKMLVLQVEYHEISTMISSLNFLHKPSLTFHEFSVFLSQGNIQSGKHDLFDLFAERGNSVNPYDGEETIDALQVIVTLLLLSIGTITQKLGKLINVFALERNQFLTSEEFAIMKIVLANSIELITNSKLQINDEIPFKQSWHSTEIFQNLLADIANAVWIGDVFLINFTFLINALCRCFLF